MNFKTTLLLLVLLAGAAGGYLLLRSSGGPTPPATDVAAPTPLVTGRSFSSLRIDRGGEAVAFENVAGRWRQTAPVRFPVRADAIEALINAGLSLTPRQSFAVDDGSENTVVSQPSDATTGLDQPAAVVTFVSDTGTHTLELGRTSIAGSAYLRTVRDGAIHLVDPTLHQLVPTADPAGLWPQKLPTLRAPRISAIDLRSNNRVTALRRTGEGWTLGTRGDERAHAPAVEQIAAVAEDVPVLRYVGVAEGALSKYGLDEPAAVLGVADPAGTRQTLRLGGPADLNEQTRYATWSDTDEPSPVVFVMPAVHAAALRADPETLRDPRIVTALPESIRGQSVNRVGRDSLELALAGPGGTPSPSGARFAFVEPSPGYTPDPELAASWLTLLTRLPAEGFSRAPREAQAPLAIVELKLAGDRSEFVRLYADRDGRENTLLAVRENEAVAALVSHEAVAPLLAPVVTLRDRMLPASTPLDVVRLERDDAHEFVFVRENDGRWSLEGADAEWEAVAFSRLQDWLEAPRVAEWTARSELPRGPIARLSTGSDRPAYVVNVDQNLGQRTDLPGVFRLPPEVGPLLAREYRRRMLLPVRADEIRRVVVWSGREAVTTAEEDPASGTVVRRGEDGAPLDANGRALPDPEGWTPLFSHLAGLSAKRYFEGRPDESPADLLIRLETADGRTHTLEHFEAGRWSFDGQPLFIDADLNDALTDPAAAWNTASGTPGAGATE
ncbi:MAG: DUF4340 domain-containing protein [Planctomycetota bacterium]